MINGFELTSAQILDLGRKLIAHLRSEIADTNGQGDWTESNLAALRTFKADGFDLQAFPSPKGTDRAEQRSEFLVDFVAWAQNRGILIAAESEWIQGIKELQHDFEKLFVIRSPIKLMICRTDDKHPAPSIREGLFSYMKDCCSEFSPGELFIIYCVKWTEDDGIRGDVAYELQILGEPTHRGITSEQFMPV